MKACLLLVSLLLLVASTLASCETCGRDIVLDLKPSARNPRNSEGDFVQLKDGSILFAYSRYRTDRTVKFDEATWDNGTCDIAARFSMDGGETWSTEDRILQRCTDAQNLMSVSFLRLKGGRLAMFYLRKDSSTLCRPVMTVSADEGRTWGPWKALLDDQGWYIVNNARVTRLKGGRILLPVALHDKTGGKFSPPGDLFVLYSDDDGLTWRKSSVVRAMQDGERVVTQEPGVIELKDGRVKMWTRTDRGCQWSVESMDGGTTWGNARPWTLVAPCSPATVNRLSDGRLIAVWNDHTGFSTKDGRRTPLVAAFSSDEGETWLGRTVLEDDPDGFFCYTAVLELSDKLLFGYCVKTEHNLDTLRISRMPSIKIQNKKE